MFEDFEEELTAIDYEAYQGSPMVSDEPAKVFQNETEAAETARELLEADEDDWQYIVESDPSGSGRALIIILDECGEFCGYWTSKLDRLFKKPLSPT